MIRAVLFDLGGVILSSPFEGFARYEAGAGLPAGFLRRLVADNAADNAWARFERGQLDLEGFAAAFGAEGAAAGHRVDGRAVAACVMGELRPAMVEALRAIKARGLKLALLTNNFPAAPGAGLAELLPGLAAVMPLFDVVVESSKAGVRKPEPAFYELALRQLGVAPAEAVFLDDLGGNLKPARALGMTTLRVDEPGEALRALEGLLGFPLRAAAPLPFSSRRL